MATPLAMNKLADIVEHSDHPALVIAAAKIIFDACSELFKKETNDGDTH